MNLLIKDRDPTLMGRHFDYFIECN